MGFTGFIQHLCFLRHVVMVTKIVKLKITRIKDTKGLLEYCIGSWPLFVSIDVRLKEHRDQASNNNISPEAFTLYTAQPVRKIEAIISLSPLPPNPKLLHNVWLWLPLWLWCHAHVPDLLIGDLITLFYSGTTKIIVQTLGFFLECTGGYVSFVIKDFHLQGWILVSWSIYFWQKMEVPKEISYLMYHSSLLNVSQNLWYLLPEK